MIIAHEIKAAKQPISVAEKNQHLTFEKTSIYCSIHLKRFL